MARPVPELGAACPPGMLPVGPESYFSPGVPNERLGRVPGLERALQSVWMRGASINNTLTHPVFQPFEQLYRRLPEQGIHSSSVSPERPIAIDLGAFRVPRQMSVLLFDLRPDIYRFSGADPNDYVPVEPRRFAGQIGWDLSIDGTRHGNTRFELQPLARQIDLASSEAAAGNATDAEFAAARANSFASSTGAGTALQPQRHERYGAPSMPLTLVVHENQVFRARAVVFRRVMSPIAFFEYDVAGVLMPANLVADIFRAISPQGAP